MAELRYGDDKTVHDTKRLDVEVDKDGNVVSVWFRCALVPFHATKVDAARAAEMRRAYDRNFPPGLKAVVFDA